MTNILILADGSIAKDFITSINNNKVPENEYFVSCYRAKALIEKEVHNIKVSNDDPTSYSKLKAIMSNRDFDTVLVIMEQIEDVKQVLLNLEQIDDKIRIVVLHQWGNEKLEKRTNQTLVLYHNKIISAYLYDQLPNVPLVGQNIGLGQGEIMEVHIPYGSSYAYRHVGSIIQRKWKIVAIYRSDKQILPTNGSMIYPNDTLLIVGKPILLEGVYKKIKQKKDIFPEPFGRNLYLILDFNFDSKKAIFYLKESIKFVAKLPEKILVVRVIHLNDFILLHALKSLESSNIRIFVCYENNFLEIIKLIEYDINDFNIGVVLNSIKTFKRNNLKNLFYALKKMVYIFGETKILDIKEAIILMDKSEKMETISSTAFDLSNVMDIELTLGYFDPEGDFEEKKIVIEHYETLSQILKKDLNIEQKLANPIRELSNRENILQIVPYDKSLNESFYKRFISKNIDDFVLITEKHPKLLVPFIIVDN